MKESRAAKLLFKKVNSMINRMDTVLTELERKEKQLKEKVHAAEQSEEVQKPPAADEELVRIDELMSAIKKVRGKRNFYIPGKRELHYNFPNCRSRTSRTIRG